MLGLKKSLLIRSAEQKSEALSRYSSAKYIFIMGWNRPTNAVQNKTRKKASSGSASASQMACKHFDGL